MPSLSPTAIQLIALLNNINDLVTISNDRNAAKDVMRALKIYAKNKNFKVDEEKIENFMAVLLDSRPFTVSYLLQDIASDISKFDLKKAKKLK